jgi:hypothetical protein
MFKNNISFALINRDSQWRTDFSLRFIEYWSRVFNGDAFRDRILFPTTIDEALETCETDFLLIQSPGWITVDAGFFKSLEKQLSLKEDICISNVVLEEDYMRINENCLLLHVSVLRSFPGLRYSSRIKEGPAIQVKKDGSAIVEIVPKPVVGNTFVPLRCAASGAEILVEQLETFGRVKTINGVVPSDSRFFLDKTSAYNEIHYETLFEKTVLRAHSSLVWAEDREPIDLTSQDCQSLVVCPASGLRPLSLVQHTGARQLIIYDCSAAALELQRRIFNTSEPAIFGDIVRGFLADHPSVTMVDGWQSEEYVAVPKIDGLDIRYVHLDACGYEIESLIRSLATDSSVLFDFSDIYGYPFNFYKRPLYQIEGLFGEVYSLLKSRTAPTKITGFAPGWRSMDSVLVNTERRQFDESEIRKYEEVRAAAAEDGSGRLPSFIFSLQKLGERTLDILPNFIFPAKIFPKSEPAKQPTIPQHEVRVAPAPPPPPPEPPPTLQQLATSLGYALSADSGLPGGPLGGWTVCRKNESLGDLDVCFEYWINESTGIWTFRAGKIQGTRRIEFSNGLNQESLFKHMKIKIKINPKTSMKYFREH